MTNQTTLIIFGRQLKDVPKKPMLPSGYRMEQLLAIGLIHSASEKSIESGGERITILFHWFLSPTVHDMIDWIIAINNSIPDNKQLITNDELTMSLVMAEATYFNQTMMLHDQLYGTNAAAQHSAASILHGKSLLSLCHQRTLLVEGILTVKRNSIVIPMVTRLLGIHYVMKPPKGVFLARLDIDVYVGVYCHSLSCLVLLVYVAIY